MPSYARKHQLQNSLIYHAFNRSSGRKVIFHGASDFEYFKWLLREYSARFKATIYHWVIMLNHYHLVLEIEQPELISKFMAGMHRAYNYYYSKQYDSVGHLWQGRFKLQPIQRELYLKNCGRYVERNPVRAGLVKEVCDYAYSSARFYCLGQEDGLTQVSPDFENFGKSLVQRQAVYKKFLEVSDVQDEAKFLDMEIPCGDQDFTHKLVRTDGHYFPRRQGRNSAIFVL